MVGVGRSLDANRHFNAAVAAFQRGDYENSTAHYRTGLTCCPDALTALLDLAKVHENLGEWELALDALDRALDLCPDHPVGLRRRTRILEEKQTFDAIASRLTGHEADAFRDRFLVTASRDVSPEVCETASRALSQAYWQIGNALSAFPSEPALVQLLPTVGALRHGWPLWTSGITQDDGTIVIFVRARGPHPGLLAALLRHEYAHLLTLTATGWQGPHWVHEAIAEWFAKPTMRWEDEQLDEAIGNGVCLPFKSLEIPFVCLPAGEVSLAYRQCARLGQRFFKGFGALAVRAILQYLRRGEPIADAMMAVCDVRIAELEARLFRAPREAVGSPDAAD